MNKEHRPNRVLGAAAILLCLCLISAHFTTGLYARYTTRASGSDSARVAKFSVQIVSATEKVAPNENGEATYEVTVSNLSEVAVSCLVELEFARTIKVTEATYAVGTNTATGTSGSADNIVGGHLNMAPGEKNVVLTFVVTFDKASLAKTLNIVNTSTDANDNISTATGSIDFTAKATFTQID